MIPAPLSPEQLRALEEFWREEDELNGTTSNATICIRHIRYMESQRQRSTALV